MKTSFDLLGITGLRKKPPSPYKKYAKFNRRMMAATIDSLLAMVTISPVLDYVFDAVYRQPAFDLQTLQQRLQSTSNDHEAEVIFWRSIVDSGYLGWWLSSSVLQTIGAAIATGICWWFWSATPGKMIMRIKIVDATTEAPITGRQILLRLFGYVVSSLGFFIGFLWIGIDKRKQGWHDKIAHTVVIVLPWRKAKSALPTADPSNSPAPSAAE